MMLATPHFAIAAPASYAATFRIDAFAVIIAAADCRRRDAFRDALLA